MCAEGFEKCSSLTQVLRKSEQLWRAAEAAGKLAWLKWQAPRNLRNQEAQ